MAAIYGGGVLGCHGITEIVAEADTRRRRGIESAWDTSKKKKKPLTCGPGLSAGGGKVRGGSAGVRLGRLRCGAQGKKLAGLRPKLKERESSGPGRRKGRELGQ